LVAFRIGAEDAPYITREFQPYFVEIDMLNLPNRLIYLKFTIGGTPARPFSASINRLI
jgi:hypothetical protein